MEQGRRKFFGSLFGGIAAAGSIAAIPAKVEPIPPLPAPPQIVTVEVEKIVKVREVERPMPWLTPPSERRERRMQFMMQDYETRKEETKDDPKSKVEICL